MDGYTPRIESLISPQRDQKKRKLLKKAMNSDIAYWLEHNRITQRCVRKGDITNILMKMMMQEELENSDDIFFTKIK